MVAHPTARVLSDQRRKTRSAAKDSAETKKWNEILRILEVAPILEVPSLPNCNLPELSNRRTVTCPCFSQLLIRFSSYIQIVMLCYCDCFCYFIVIVIVIVIFIVIVVVIVRCVLAAMLVASLWRPVLGPIGPQSACVGAGSMRT